MFNMFKTDLKIRLYVIYNTLLNGQNLLTRISVRK